MIEFLLFFIAEASQWEYEKGGTVRAATIARQFQWVWDEKNVRQNTLISPISFCRKKV